MAFTRIALVTFVVFLILKLCGVTEHWSWGFVLLPAAWVFGAAFREIEIETATGKKIDVGI